jgi:NADH-quinone oxidoreductase subunit I
MIRHWIKSFFLWEFVKAHYLTLKYFFRPRRRSTIPMRRTR